MQAISGIPALDYGQYKQELVDPKGGIPRTHMHARTKNTHAHTYTHAHTR